MNPSLALRKDFDFRAKILKYWAAFKANYFTNTAYAADLFAMALSVVIRIWLFYQLYGVVFKEAGAEEIGGFNLPLTIWYLALAQCIINSTRPRLIIRGIMQDIQSGNIAYQIARPYGYILYNIFTAFGRIAANMLSALSLSVAACLLLVGSVDLTWQGLLAGCLLLVGGLLMNIIQSIAIGCLAFWSEDVTAFERIYHKANLVFGGVVVPLTFFPGVLRTVAELLPFSQSFYPPVHMVLDFNGSLFLRLALVQAFWILASLMLAALLFKKGVKNVNLNGG